MSSFNFGVSHEDGVQSGRAVLDVIRDVGLVRGEFQPECEAEQLLPIFEFVAEHGGRGRLPYIEGFLSQIVRPTELAGEIITLWGADQFIANQQEFAPICNIPAECRLVQFGYWTGDWSDGDGWCIDFDDELIRCVPVAGSDDQGVDYMRRQTYACFPSLRHLAPYLRTTAEARGWL